VLGLRQVERCCPVARELERPARRRTKLCFGLGIPGGPRELERLQVMVGEDVRQILRSAACLLLDPRCGGAMLTDARGARDLLVRDIADEHMPERILRLALHGAAPGRADEL